MKKKIILVLYLLIVNMNVFALNINDLKEIEGSNPTKEELNNYIQVKCKEAKIPPIIVKAILLKEGAVGHKWKQYSPEPLYAHNTIVYHPDLDSSGNIKSYGLGLFQITYPVDSSGLFTGDQGEIIKVVSDWKFNVDMAINKLTVKWNLNINGFTGEDVNSFIIENWFYPIAWYNGEGVNALAYVKHIYGYMQNINKVQEALLSSKWQTEEINLYYSSIPNIVSPLELNSFTLLTSISGSNPLPYILAEIKTLNKGIHVWEPDNSFGYNEYYIELYNENKINPSISENLENKNIYSLNGNTTLLPPTKMFSTAMDDEGSNTIIAFINNDNSKSRLVNYSNKLTKPFSYDDQCVTYAWARFYELYEYNALYSPETFQKVKSALENYGSARHAKYWDQDDIFKNTFSSFKINNTNDARRLKAGQFVVWDNGEYGHIGIVEEVNIKENYYKVSDLNADLEGNYDLKIFPIIDTSSRKYTKYTIPKSDKFIKVYPKFLDLPINSNFKQPLFYDVSENDWYYKYIKILKDKEIIGGQNGYFYPDKKLTQFELLVMLNNLFFNKEFTTYLRNQSNPNDQHNYFNFRNTILKYETKDNYVNREVVADVLYEIFKQEFTLPDPELSLPFEVWNINNEKYYSIIRSNNDWNYTASFLKAIKVSSGYKDGTYGLKNHITKAEASVLLVKAYHFLEANK